MLRRMLCVLSVVVLSQVSVAAAERPTEPIRLWTGAAPDAKGEADVDIPTLTPYWPAAEKATGAAFIVAPGGGYSVLAPHEGATYAQWLSDLGIAAFVLKYRLNKNGYYLPTIQQDAARAVRLLRHRAAEWQLDPQRIGMMGSSAGGHLTANQITSFDAGKSDAADPIDRLSSRPDAAVLCYAFILLDRPGSEPRQERFLGPANTPENVRRFSPALNVTKDTPPTFVWQTVEDPTVLTENAMVFCNALRVAGVPFDLHLYQKGKHGIGLGLKDYDPAKLHPWAADCAFWLGEQGFLKK